MSVYLSDIRRVEMAVPAALLLALIRLSRFGVGSEEGVENPAADDTAAEETKRQLTAWCDAALDEPFADLPPRKCAALLRRTKKIAAGATAELDDQHVLKIGMVMFYLLEELAQRDILHVVEGSNIARAMEVLIDCMGHGFRTEKLDASAQKRASQILREFQRLGFYREASVQPIASAHALSGEGSR